MQLTKIRDLSAEELATAVVQAGEQLFRIRFQKTLGNKEGLKRLRGLKLDIARMKTVARERSIAANPNGVVKGRYSLPEVATKLTVRREE